MRHYLDTRTASFLLFSSITIIVSYELVKTLFTWSLRHEIYDYIPAIPLMSLVFIWMGRKDIFSTKEYSLQAGIGIVVLGGLLYLGGLSQHGRLNEDDYLAIGSVSIVIIFIGGFILFYGVEAFRKAIFPLAFLFLVAPLPSFVMERIIAILQEGSAETSLVLFKLSGVPVLREGFIFHLPSISIEVAKQCSGIHSAVALLISSIIAGQLFLVSVWRKSILCLCVVPIATLKNGLRIVILSVLGNNLDERILSSSLHRQGGVPFFVLSVSLLLVVVVVLRKSENSRSVNHYGVRWVQADGGKP